jgi:hypothetical protein
LTKRLAFSNPQGAAPTGVLFSSHNGHDNSTFPDDMAAVPRPSSSGLPQSSGGSIIESPEHHGAFEYRPLDHATCSIRLLLILPETSPEGYIQCILQQADINDTFYSCLSYVWGPPDEGNVIVLNGKHHTVRRNLFDFLQVARIRHTNKQLWIDALSIDQNNVAERNHQVQQMGDIFANAEEVLAWFGSDNAVVRFLTNKRLWRPPKTRDEEWDRMNFVHSPYWKRAWITQEVLLARRIKLCAGYAKFDRKRLLSVCEQGFSDSMDDLIKPKANIKRSGLITLLKTYAEKECHIPRDRIYSLLSLCSTLVDFSGTPCKLPVDYAASDLDVLRQTMKSCINYLCFCTIACVASVLGIRPRGPHSKQLFGEIPVQSFNIITVDGKRRRKCYGCNLTLPSVDSTKVSSSIACLQRVCPGDLMTGYHIVVETPANEWLSRGWEDRNRLIRNLRCEGLKVPDGSRVFDSGVALSHGYCTRFLCMSLARVMDFARIIPRRRLHPHDDNETLHWDFDNADNGMRLCNHDVHE